MEIDDVPADVGLNGGSDTAGVDELPSEVIEQVFRHLSMTDRMAFARVCRNLQHIYTNSSRLQYDFELRTNAYLDVPYDPPSTDLSMDHVATPTPDTVKSVTYGAPTRGHHSINEEEEETEQRQVRDPAMPISASDKLDSLKRLGSNWETLDWASKRSITVDGPARIYELQEGIFLMCERFGNDDEGEPPTTIRLIPLPRHEDQWLEYPPLPLKSQEMKFPIADLTMDPTQDLIVVSEYIPSAPDGATHKYHLLTLSTFQPHPLATLPVLDFPPQGHMVWRTTQLLQVMGDVLVILVSRYIANWVLAGIPMALPGLAHANNEEELVVWNWKEGNVLARLASPENGYFSSLAILTPTTFMITAASATSAAGNRLNDDASLSPPVIQIYSFDAHPVHSPVQPLLVDYMDDNTPRPVLVAQLEMPHFNPGIAVASFNIRPDPAFPPRQPGNAPRLGGSKPFTQDPEKGVVVFDLHVREPFEDEGQQRRETVSYELFVLRELFVDFAKEGEERLAAAKDQAGPEGWRRSDVEITVPWQEWGRYGARLMDMSMEERRWVCSCAGYRFMSLIPSDDTPEPVDTHDDTPARFSDLRMYDFSPYGVRKEQSKLERRRPRPRMRQSRSPMPFSNSPGPGNSRRRASSTHQAQETDYDRPWESVQDIATSTAPAHLTREDVQALVSRVQARGRRGYAEPAPTELDDLTIMQFREQYDRLFWATAKNRVKSDRADRERGRGRAGGNRSESRSRSRSQSTHVDGGSPIAERRSRSARSTSPEAIFRATRNPINMSGTRQAGEAITDDETEFEVRLVMAPTVLEKRRIWKEDVVTSLPFREVWRRLEQRANGVMIDDERVMVIRTETQRVFGEDHEHQVVQELTVLCM